MPVINDPPPTGSTADPAVSATLALVLSSPSLPTPAADSLYERLDFKSKKKPPHSVQFLPAQAQVPSVPFDPQPAGQPPLVLEPAPGGAQQANPSHSITDPVRYVSWGPKTVYYVSDDPTHKGSSSSSSKHGSSSSSSSHLTQKSKGKKDRGHRFEKVRLRGREQMQTTEKTEMLPLEQGGGIRRTWVSVTRLEVVSEETQVEEKDVVVESSDNSDSDSDSGGGELKKQRRRKAERKGLKVVGWKEEDGGEKKKKKKKKKREHKEEKGDGEKKE
ncbi:MAG: hypothetical protein LQ352_001102 [Teloschistes flavicans]|nr:MAG: hypothetical protein LQ352_001102 [Teloschistes flavicans]